MGARMQASGRALGLAGEPQQNWPSDQIRLFTNLGLQSLCTPIFFLSFRKDYSPPCLLHLLGFKGPGLRAHRVLNAYGSV